MKIVDIREMLKMPAGTIYTRSSIWNGYSLANGLYVKGELNVSENLLWAGGHDILDRHTHDTFLVYEPADIDRLAGLIGRGPGWVAHKGVEGER